MPPPGAQHISIPLTHRLAVLVVVALGLVPLTLAWSVCGRPGITPVEALFTVHQQPVCHGSAEVFTSRPSPQPCSPWPLVSRLHGPSGAIGGEATAEASVAFSLCHAPIVAAVGFLVAHPTVCTE